MTYSDQHFKNIFLFWWPSSKFVHFLIFPKSRCLHLNCFQTYWELWPLITVKELWPQILCCALIGLGERLKRPAPKTSETSKNFIKKKPTVSCVSCDQDLSSQSIFHLPCQHIMCRSCLLKETEQSDNNSTCKLCKTTYRRTNVVRVHNVWQSFSQKGL